MSQTAPQPSEKEPAQDEDKPGVLQRYRERYPWLDHLVRTGQNYTANHGDHYAAAITYFSVLSLVPILMLTFAAMGFVLANNPELLARLQEQIGASMPEGLDNLVNQIVDQAITSRNSVGLIGLLLALYTGLYWMGNLRAALTAQWDQQPEPAGFLRTAVGDLLVLFGLGFALLLSFAITSLGVAFADEVLALVGLGGMLWAQRLIYLLSIGLSLVAMWLVFVWVIARLPRLSVTLRSAMRAAVLAALGFEVLKQAFAVYLDIVIASPTGRVFGPVIGLMVFAYFVSRLLLFATAWAATTRENRRLLTGNP